MTISKYYLSAFFLFIMLIVVPLYIVLSPFSGNGKVQIVSEVYSPNKQFKVVEYVYLLGGALGSCKRHLTIQVQEQKAPTADNLPTSVFSASCRVDVSFVWVNDGEVKIKYLIKELVEPDVELNPKTNVTYNRISVEYESDITQ